MHILCPCCGGDFTQNIFSESQEGCCVKCSLPWREEKNVLFWGNRERKKITFSHIFNKIKNQFYLSSNVFLPFRYISQGLVEKFYRDTLTNHELARRWRGHYFRQLKIEPGNKILDFGCGRGRHVSICNQLGYKTFGQDINSYAWWKKISNTRFQVVSPQFSMLPWRRESFSAVLCFTVLQYVSADLAAEYVKEIFRILKPGGYCILQGANDQGYGVKCFHKQMGYLYSLEKMQMIFKSAGFKEIIMWYEGFHFPFFPSFFNFIRSIFLRRAVEFLDYGGFLESITHPKKRVTWVITFQKPLQ